MKIATHTALLVSIVALATFCAPVSAQEADAEKITFDDHITPILRARCSSCHNPNKKNGDLDVTNYTALMIGGGSGEVIVPGDSLDSFFYGVITHEEAPEMPPNGKLADEQIELIKNWIDGGALENSGSVANIQPKVEMAVGEALMTRPEVVPMPGRIPLQPAITTSRPGAVTAMATSPWAPVVAIAAPGQVVLYDTSKTALIGIFPLPEENGSSTTATALRFSRNGSLLVAGVGRPGASGRVMIWDVGSGDLLS
ncbi:MAG: c-type cytochrome domain-containing protein, partial [Planctomycetota bacterium]